MFTGYNLEEYLVVLWNEYGQRSERKWYIALLRGKKRKKDVHTRFTLKKEKKVISLVKIPGSKPAYGSLGSRLLASGFL